jgi:hypothetical protein
LFSLPLFGEFSIDLSFMLLLPTLTFYLFFYAGDTLTFFRVWLYGGDIESLASYAFAGALDAALA